MASTPKSDVAQALRSSSPSGIIASVYKTVWGRIVAILIRLVRDFDLAEETDWAPIVRLYEGSERLQSSPIVTLNRAVAIAMEIRATARSFGKPHSTIMRWEQRLAQQTPQWSPPAPAGSDVTLEGDAVYTRVSENLPPPAASEGWRIHFSERQRRYRTTAQAGKK